MSIFALLQWSAAPSNQHNAQQVQRRDMHYPRQAVVTTTPDSGGGATTTSELITSVTETAPASTNPDAFVPLEPETTDDATMSTNPDAFVPLDPKTTTTPQVAGTTAPDAFIPVDAETSTTAPDAYVPISPNTAKSTTVAFTTTQDAYVPLGPSATGATITKPTAATFVVTTTGANIPGGTLVITGTGSYSPGEPLLITATGSNIPGGSLVVTRTGPLVVDATGSAGKPSDFSDIPDDSFAVYNGGFTIGDYFVGAYLPTLLAVIYGICWNIIFAGIAEIMPFFQLTREGGATAKESVCLEYQNAGLWHLLSTSISHKNGLVFAGTFITLIITATIAFAAQVFYIGISGTCRETGKGKDCIRYLGINRRLAWAECGMLAVILVIVLAIAFVRRRKSTGVYAEVTSIAGIAVLMQNPTVVARMRESVHNHRNKLNDTVTTKFGIGQSYHEGTGWTYGFTIVAESQYAEAKDEKVHLFNEDLGKTSSVLPLLLRPFAIVAFQIILLGLLTIILYYWFNGSPSALEDFMNSQTFGPKLMMSCFGIIIRFWWAEISNGKQDSRLPFPELPNWHTPASQPSTLSSPTAALLPAMPMPTNPC